ncbi:hypothetical protein ACHWQZ_G003176 [Mnemiopsis leidyi]
MERLQSKNLFNFPLKGIAEGPVAEFAAQIKKISSSGPPAEIGRKINELALNDDAQSLDQLLLMIRANNDGLAMVMRSFPPFQEAAKNTTTTEFKVPTSHDGNFDVPVEVYTPDSLVGKSGNSAYIFAHGGGCVSGKAKDSKPFLAFLALSANVVVFNVDYRLAPETKAPNNVKDFYEAVKHISKNAKQLGVDPGKICIGGESGGGYICLGTCVLLAQHDESHLIKLALPIIPMVDDYAFSNPHSMTVDERSGFMVMRRIWTMISADLSTQSDDPLLYPGKASDEILARFPPTIVVEGEFDMFITESCRLATRLRNAGRLLELVVFPGVTHHICLWPGFRISEMFDGTMKKIFDEYLHK